VIEPTVASFAGCVATLTFKLETGKNTSLSR
jgi:hypothetical protein